MQWTEAEMDKLRHCKGGEHSYKDTGQLPQNLYSMVHVVAGT